MNQYIPRSNIMHRDQPPSAEVLLGDIISYTQEVADFLGIAWNAKGRRNYREWEDGFPTGWCSHFTASNAAVTPSRELGRIPVLFRRFARNSGSPGVHFITWDTYVPQFEHIRQKYPSLQALGTDVWCWGLDKAFYHGNDLNDFCLGIEHRNIGHLKKRDDGSYGWGRGGKIDYVGRKPVWVRGVPYEPFTRGQIQAAIVLGRLSTQLYPMESHRFLGHLHVTSNRTDPMRHFPLQLVRESVFFDPTTPLKGTDWLMAFGDDPDFYQRKDRYMEEWLSEDMTPGEMDSLTDEELAAGQRHFDEGLDSDGDLMDIWARVGGDIELSPDLADQFGKDAVVSEGDVVEAKKALTLLGYWPFAWRAAFTAGPTPEFVWTLKMFQRRWVRQKGRRIYHTVPDTGEVDAITAQKLTEMLGQYDLLPS